MSAETPISTILIHGRGLAGQICAAALRAALPESIAIIWTGAAKDAAADIGYGSVTTPDSYAFNLNAGVTEPDLVQNSPAAFSFGTNYKDWGADKLSWMQCFHLPFAIIDGVPLHHHLIRRDEFNLGNYLISASAAIAGRFAHPPEQANMALAMAEYGYQFDIASYGAIFERAAKNGGLSAQASEVASIQTDGDNIASVTLENGQGLSADLYIDCSGPDAVLMSALGQRRNTLRSIFIAAALEPQPSLGAPKREVSAKPFGYMAHTPLQGHKQIMAVSAPEDMDTALGTLSCEPQQACTIGLGRSAQAWSGNCIAIGQAGASFDPLTPAPMKALQRDIERVLSLIPVNTDMTIERKEYNRLAGNDYDHIALFTRAFFSGELADKVAYWQQAKSIPQSAKLLRKVEQFKSRGALVTYDLEPFNVQDWTILYFGLGLRPDRYDRVADRRELSEIDGQLSTIKRGVEALTAKLPPHDLYMTKLRQHLTNRQA